MTDDFIRELRADWRAQPIEKTAVVGRLTRDRWTPQLLIWLELLQGVFGVLGGAVFLWLALDYAQLVRLFGPALEGRMPAERMAAHLLIVRIQFGLAAAVMLAAVPPLAWAAVRARRRSLKWEDETPESVLRVGLRRADASLRANRVGRWHVWVLLGFVVIQWTLPLLGLAPVSLVVFITAIYAAIIAPVWLWLDLRRERVRRELETCLKLLEDYRTPEN